MNILPRLLKHQLPGLNGHTYHWVKGKHFSTSWMHFLPHPQHSMCKTRWCWEVPASAQPVSHNYSQQKPGCSPWNYFNHNIGNERGAEENRGDTVWQQSACFKMITWSPVNQPAVLVCLLHTGTSSVYTQNSALKYSPSNHYVNGYVFNFLYPLTKKYVSCR